MILLQNYEAAHELLDQSIAENPESGVPYFYKAMTYSDHALLMADPSDRKPYYRNFREAFLTAREKFEAQESQPNEARQLDNLMLEAWGTEHNEAVQYVTDDSLMQSIAEPYKLAAAHLENAVIINPDSLLSYEVLAQIYAIDDRPVEAIKVMNKVMSMKNPPSSDDYSRLSDYYVRAAMPDSAIYILNEGLTHYPDTVILSQKLADAYMDNNQREESIAVIERLLQLDPNNAQYHLALGSRILIATASLSDSISANYDRLYALSGQLRNANQSQKSSLEAQIKELENKNESIRAEIDDLNDYAERELLSVIELEPNSGTAYNALGIIYQNKAAAFFDLRNYTTDNTLAMEYDASAKEALNVAMGYYEKAVEINPDNLGAWQSLSSIYITLDMKEKAEKALEKLNN